MKLELTTTNDNSTTLIILPAIGYERIDTKEYCERDIIIAYGRRLFTLTLKSYKPKAVPTYEVIK